MGEVHRAEYSTKVFWPCPASGDCPLCCSEHCTFINRTPGDPSSLATSPLLVCTELGVRETLQFPIASCYFCWSHPTFIRFFAAKCRCLHSPHYHLFLHFGQRVWFGSADDTEVRHRNRAPLDVFCAFPSGASLAGSPPSRSLASRGHIGVLGQT